MTSAQHSWSAEEFYSWLRHTPSRLEPGVDFQDDPLEISGSIRAELCGTDANGQPLLVFWVEECDADLENLLLEAMSSLQNEPGRFSARFPSLAKPECRPRAVVFTAALEDSFRRRLELLNRAFPLRVMSVRMSDDDGNPQPKLVLEIPATVAPPPWELPGLCELGAMHCQRLINACGMVLPPVGVMMDTWPLLLSGRHGVLASLHCVDGHVQFTWAPQRRHAQRKTDYNPAQLHRSLLLVEEEDVDLAIDVIMREQYASAEGESEFQEVSADTATG